MVWHEPSLSVHACALRAKPLARCPAPYMQARPILKTHALQVFPLKFAVRRLTRKSNSPPSLSKQQSKMSSTTPCDVFFTIYNQWNEPLVNPKITLSSGTLVGSLPSIIPAQGSAITIQISAGDDGGKLH